MESDLSPRGDGRNNEKVKHNMTLYRWITIAGTLLCLLSHPVWAQVNDAKGSPTPNPEFAPIAAKIVDLTNEARQKGGAQVTSPIIYLESAATGHSEEMLKLNYFSHTSPTPGRERPKKRIQLAGGWDLGLAENIYRCRGIPSEELAEAVVGAWLKSPTHYKNLMNGTFNRIGIGIAKSGDEFAITQLFSFQAISIESLVSSPSGDGYSVTLRGRVVSGGKTGAIIFGGSIKSKFEAGADGLFEVKFEAPGDQMIAVGLKGENGRYSIDLEFPANAGN